MSRHTLLFVIAALAGFAWGRLDALNERLERIHALATQCPGAWSTMRVREGHTVLICTTAEGRIGFMERID